MAQNGNHEPSGFLSGNQSVAKEPRSWIPWIIAGAAVVIIVAVLVVTGRHKQQAANPGGAGLAPPDAYAVSLPISNIAMSESSNLAGGKVTYIDGQIANHGSKTVEGVTVQIAFRNALNEISQKETMPLMLIRTHEPYVDTQSVSAAPLKPGDHREFRLIFDHVADDWNQQYPEIRVIGVTGK
ncbi:DUF2393 family protein [Acidipila rosea]|uniref:Uncharacterized protein DUF2393 n=1 Tax=Acidipila rosea TaxID=768535 RepID=A0A4R1L9L0_9BACT|nr:DUF2393 family protein [Acidipila rosea]TCK75036.1 uncharacterized protein DUF2393 [Acidipila rosea]